MCKCWSQWLLIAVIFAFSIMTLFSLSGCGIKGPLYLPNKEDAQAKPAKKETKQEKTQHTAQAREK